MAIIQRKRHQLTFPNKTSKGFPDFLGIAKIGPMEYCYFNEGRSFHKGPHQFELSTLTLPKGVQVVKEGSQFGERLTEAFMMPILIDLLPADDLPNFAEGFWHYCEDPNSVGHAGKVFCSTGVLNAKNEQVVLFYDDSASGLIPRKKMDSNDTEEVGQPYDPNNRYYLLPLLLPNQTICFYLVPEQEDIQNNIIAQWQADLKNWLSIIKMWQTEGDASRPVPQFFVAGDSPLIFDDTLQMFFALDVKMPTPPEGVYIHRSREINLAA